jgi:membrane-bound metal-dependent hydrolase YbcI (DUF457 family)
MLTTGHLAAGALLGAVRARGAERPAAVIAGGMVAANLPDLDLLLPRALDRLGIAHGLHSGVHHRWATHTPVFWTGVATVLRRLARRSWAGSWGVEVADTVALGVAIHLVQDTVANTVSLLWPLRRREYGLGLDGLAGVTDHREYVRRYPASAAGRLEGALVLTAAVVCAHVLGRSRRRLR